jgi:hypothetical protein
LVIWINFGKITGFALEKVVENFNTEINTAVSGFFAESIDDSMKFGSIQTVDDGGIRASFVLDDSVISDPSFNSYLRKSNMQIIRELGITASDIPDEIKPLFSLVKQTLYIDFTDSRGNAIISRAVSLAEINEFMNMSAAAQAAEENRILVSVARERVSRGTAVSFYIHIDGTPAAILENGNTIGIPVTPGKHKIRIINQTYGVRSDELEFEAQSADLSFTSGYNADGAGVFFRRVN